MSNKEKNNLIIVTYDFTEQADCATNHASYLAKITSGDVALVHIINKESKSKFGKNVNSVQTEIENKLNEICTKNFQNTGVKTFSIVRPGSIFSTIAEITSETKAKLVVLGTHGVKGMQHLLGAFALKVVTSSPAPVVIVQSKKVDKDGYNPIILSIDESVETKQKVNQALEFAKTHKAEVHIFSKYEKDEYLQIKVKGNSNYVKNELISEGVKVVEANEPSDSKSFSNAVIRYSANVKAGLIVITTKKEKEISDMFIGDEDVKIINNDSQIPVLCVNASNYNIMGSVIAFGGFN
ncbi:MAG: universal stress protein [Bacteroidetes bacterium]|nr:universal stress protein [Bacteroidota bacterium]